MKWNLEELYVGDVIFIIIIIIDIIVSLLPLLFYESKVLDTSLTEDVPRRWTDGGGRSPHYKRERWGVGVGNVELLSLGRL